MHSARTSAAFNTRRVLSVIAVFCMVQTAIMQSQQPSTPQPLNATVSDFGTSFAFSPPICADCVETELGFLSLEDGRYAPAVLTVAPSWLHGDASVLANVLDSEATGGHRSTHFGNRLDFALRAKVLDRHGLVLTLAPWGTAFIRGIDGGRAGAVALPLFNFGKNQVVAEFSLTGAVGVSAGNPRTDYVESFDYTRSIGERGYNIFAGLQHEVTAGVQTIGIEEGMTIPFRNGQVELATEQLTLNTDPAVQVQARVIVNWGKLLSRRAAR